MKTYYKIILSHTSHPGFFSIYTAPRLVYMYDGVQVNNPMHNTLISIINIDNTRTFLKINIYERGVVIDDNV